jgi:hypothetical protein
LGLINPKELEDFPIFPDYSKSGSLLYVELLERYKLRCKAGVEKEGVRPSNSAFLYKKILELDDNDENVVRAFAEGGNIMEERERRMRKEKRKRKERRGIKSIKYRKRVKTQNRDKRSGRWTREENEIEEKPRDDKSVAERRGIKWRGCRQGAKRPRTEQSSVRWTRSKTRNDSGAHAV